MSGTRCLAPRPRMKKPAVVRQGIAQLPRPTRQRATGDISHDPATGKIRASSDLIPNVRAITLAYDPGGIDFTRIEFGLLPRPSTQAIRCIHLTPMGEIGFTRVNSFRI